MARIPEKNFLRAWREHRGMTQSKLAEMVDTTGAVISLLESGDRGLSDKWLRRLAPVLGTTPGHLLDVHPDEAPNDYEQIWARIPEDRRGHALEVLKTFSVVDINDFKKKADEAESQNVGKTRTRRGRKTP